MFYVDANAPLGGQMLSCAFEKVSKSLFPLRKNPYFPDEKPMYQSPWVGQSAKSLLKGDESEDMLKILKEQHAYVLSQQDFMLRKQREAESLTKNSQADSIQTQQIALIRDTLQGFQDSMATMMQVASEMVQKVCEQPVPVPPAMAPPMFEKSAVSHRRPAIRPIPHDQGNLALKVVENHQPLNDHPHSEPIRVQPHPISKRLERITD